MGRAQCFIALTILFLLAVLVTARFGSAAAPDTRIRRGDYLTHHVAMCVQCHSPRDDQGAIIESREFRGAIIPIQPPRWARSWAFSSVNIRGLPGWREEEAVHFLQTGQRFNGSRPQAPMPPFRMSREDAEAVVTYLKSLQ
jgi:mono/diheme cytochrome c family protein